MHTAHTRQIVRMIGMFSLLVILPACQEIPTAPTPPSIYPSPVGAVSSDSAASARTLDADATRAAPAGAAASCEPRFTKTDTADPTFFLLTLEAPAGCHWFAKEVEKGGNYWDLTVPDYSRRNRQKYPFGVAGVGSADLGVHFQTKIGYRSHRTFVLEVCAGHSCGATSQRWTWSHTIKVS